jgi:hypothetical protein
MWRYYGIACDHVHNTIQRIWLHTVLKYGTAYVMVPWNSHVCLCICMCSSSHAVSLFKTAYVHMYMRITPYLGYLLCFTMKSSNSRITTWWKQYLCIIGLIRYIYGHLHGFTVNIRNNGSSVAQHGELYLYCWVLATRYQIFTCTTEWIQVFSSIIKQREGIICSLLRGDIGGAISTYLHGFIVFK